MYASQGIQRGVYAPPPCYLRDLCKRPRDVRYVVEEEEELIIIEGKTKNLLKRMLELWM